MPTTSTNLYFPQVIDTVQGGNWMIITAMAPGSSNAPVGSIGLFIPGATSGSNVIFGSRHEYSETKLSKVIADAALSPIGLGLGAISGAAAMQGVTINPKVEVLYRDTDLRNFQFQFIMSPANQAESQTIINIVTLLRQWSAPTLIGGTSDPRQGYIANQGFFGGYLGSGGMFYTPNEFLIDFMMPDINQNLVVNTSIPKIGRCVIEGIEVMYNPNGEWSTFADGSPVSTQLTLAFREMRVIDSKNIAGGY